MTEEEKILQRIAKLLALSRSANPNEAAAAAAKAQELAFQYNIDLARAATFHVGAEDAVQRERYPLGVPFGVPTNWRRDLIWGIARWNFCTTVVLMTTQDVWVVGREHNRKFVQFLYEHCAREIVRLADEGWRGTADIERLQHVMRWKDSFYRGAAQTITNRLYQQRQTSLGEANENTKALVVAMDQEVRDRLKWLFSSLGHFDSGSPEDYSGYAHGKKAGESVSLNRPLSGGGTDAGPRALTDGK